MSSSIPAMSPIPVILDCDPGHDDVFAIWLAAGHPNIDLRAITTVGGNGYLKYTTLNARIACTVAGIKGVPIAAGADKPLVRELRPAAHIHGENALGGPVLPEPTVPLDDRTAVQLIADTLLASIELVVLIPTGPLTNIAHLIQQRPDVLHKVKEIVWMGGSTTRGNQTPYAEFNAWVDPEAIDVVVKSGLPFTMVGLNVTHQALITSKVIDRIAAIGNETAKFGVELLKFFCSSYDVWEDMAEGPLHDPVTVAMVALPSIVKSQRAHQDVELQGTFTAGATSVDMFNMLKQEPNATIATVLDVDMYWNLISDAVATLK